MDKINKFVFNKIDATKNIITEFQRNDHLHNIFTPELKRLNTEIDELSDRFLLCSNQIHTFYEDTMTTITATMYNDMISSANIYNDLSTIYKAVLKCVDALNANKAAAVKKIYLGIKSYIDHCPAQDFYDVAAEESKPEDMYEYCTDCCIYMLADPIKSVFYCPSCGSVKSICGVLFDEPKLFGKSYIRQKSKSRFDKYKHFYKWMNRICATESEEKLGTKEPGNLRGEKYLEMIWRAVEENGKAIKTLTVVDMRLILSELGLTKLYNSIPLILKKITGVGPPTLPADIWEYTKVMFGRVIEVRPLVKDPTRSNERFYPYYIMKILDHRIPKHDYKLRTIFYYIFVQSKKTLAASDAEWELICEKLGDIQFVTSDRSITERYKPYL